MRWKKAISVVDCHAEGEVGKVIVGDVGQIPGQTMFDQKLCLERHRDDLRKLVAFVADRRQSAAMARRKFLF